MRTHVPQDNKKAISRENDNRWGKHVLEWEQQRRAKLDNLKTGRYGAS